MIRSIVAAALLSAAAPAAASPMACIVGDAWSGFDAWSERTQQVAKMKMLINIGSGRFMPGFFMMDANGTFTLLVLTEGHMCFMAVGVGVASFERAPSVEN